MKPAYLLPLFLTFISANPITYNLNAREDCYETCTETYTICYNGCYTQTIFNPFVCKAECSLKACSGKVSPPWSLKVQCADIILK
jgi:hypothetical protein